MILICLVNINEYRTFFRCSDAIQTRPRFTLACTRPVFQAIDFLPEGGEETAFLTHTDETKIFADEGLPTCSVHLHQPVAKTASPVVPLICLQRLM